MKKKNIVMQNKDIIMMIMAITLIVLSYAMLCVCKNYNAVKDGEQNLKLFKEMVTYIVDNNADMMEGAEYIAVDASSFYFISESERKLLTSFLMQYNDNVILASMNLLEEDEFKNEDDSLKGVFISVSNVEIVANKLTCQYSLYKAPLNSVGYDVKATYSGNKWKVKYKEIVS